MLLSFFSQTSFVLFFFVQIPRLECARSDLVSDVPVFFCVHGCVPFCGYMYVLVCVCFSVRISVHCLWCAYLCAHGVLLIWVFISLYMREDPSGCLSRLAFEVMLGRFYWQFD